MPPGRPSKEGAPRKPNPLRNRPPIKAPLPPIFQQKQAAAAAAAAKAPPRPARRACPNKTCSAPDVVDGVCHNCGTIVDDSNIVSEVQFGESSNGAAVVQGSFVSADQGTAKSLGPAFRRAGGMEDRESTIREGRRIMQALAGQLVIPESTIMSGVQIFKLAANNNFIQGRRMDMVAAVCLYSAARKESPCRVMLIDFADRLQVNVFKLGRTFKSLHKTITLSADGILPVLPEDLIYRFAEKLEFGEFRDKVAEDAIRMVQRMSMDWMVQGRRPSGVCGACLILAARMNNFRRTITEVVYIVKVTTHTIQKRLDEFKVTPSSALTVEEFLNNEFLETAHDPPSFYEKSEEWQKNKKKRKRRGHDGLDEEENEENSGSNGEGEDGRSKRQKTTEPNPNPDQPVQSVELRRDADGFAIPPQPTQSHDIPIDPDLVDEAIADQTSTTFDKLVAQFGDIPDA
ncbi:cyclin-like protein, partial [Hyaloscypha sp. PMI_1271]